MYHDRLQIKQLLLTAKDNDGTDKVKQDLDYIRIILGNVRISRGATSKEHRYVKYKLSLLKGYTPT